MFARKGDYDAKIGKGVNHFSLVYCPLRGLLFNINNKKEIMILFMHLTPLLKKFPSLACKS